jgi:ATP-binding cassette subfamily B multidrug efflux pump
MYSFVDGVSMLCVALMLWYGSGGEAATGVSAGLLVAFIDYIDRLFRPLREFAGKISIIQRATIALDRIFSLLEKGEQITEGSTELTETDGGIVIRDLKFAYGDGPEILQGIDLDIETGQVIALIGATGSGKSTLARLLTRTYDGYRGSIKIDGQELRDLSPTSVRRHITAVPQDVHLFPDSVRFNVGLERATEPDLLAAAEASYASGIIEALPGGWDHMLYGDNGSLSAGEGQLLTFARTMAANPDIIILDEATASVDSITEALIQRATDRLFAKKTVVVIAHRLSTISKADCIIVMEQGRIIERGDHETLVSQNGKYAKLIKEGMEV